MQKILLSESESQLLKIIKGHITDNEINNGTWFDKLIPYYNNYYGEYEDRDITDIKLCIFHILRKLQLKLNCNTDNHMDLLLNALLMKTFTNDSDDVIIRGITELCHIIKFSRYLDENNKPLYWLQ